MQIDYWEGFPYSVLDTAYLSPIPTFDNFLIYKEGKKTFDLFTFENESLKIQITRNLYL